MLSLPSFPETHDLLCLSTPELERASAVKPEWVDAALKASPWVVARRASTNGNLVPVGVRGKERATLGGIRKSRTDCTNRTAKSIAGILGRKLKARPPGFRLPSLS